jgi:hypothetical protein
MQLCYLPFLINGLASNQRKKFWKTKTCVNPMKPVYTCAFSPSKLTYQLGKFGFEQWLPIQMPLSDHAGCSKLTQVRIRDLSAGTEHQG